MERVDVAIIGSGVIGLAVAHLLSDLEKEILVVEKNASFGQETSSRNSEVIHSGLYYAKDSLKALTCIRGRDLLYDLCVQHNIPHKKLGKLVVASDKQEYKEISSIYQNAEACGVGNLSFLDKKECKRIESNVEAEAAFFSPDSGIIDSHSLMKFFLDYSKARGVEFAFSVEVIGIKKHNGYYEVIVKEPNGDSFSFYANKVINCAGLWSDKIAEFVGIDTKKYSYNLYYCKGQYFRISNPKKFNISHLVYPPPTNISLGIHITPDLGGGLRLGPDALYIENINYDINEQDRSDFFASVNKFLPVLELDDIIADTVGVRPKLQGPNGKFRDFIIREESDKGFPNFINTIGIESPGLTASLAIAEIIKNTLK